jgi:5'-nucleotidase / UDP-sugar diphosphatase
LFEDMTMKFFNVTAVAALALLSACASAPVERPPLKLTILHTNDHHGRFWPNSDGEYGMAARKTLIDRVRAEVKAAGGEVLLLDGGDINTGVPESDLQDAEPDFKGMNLLGYDASAVGNHEFDKPPEVLAKQRSWLKFPLLAANIYKDGQRLFQPYAIFERGGYKIAVMGLTTDDTRIMVLPANIAGIEFRKPIDEAAKLLPELRSKADMVIATTHMGHYPDGRRGVHAPHVRPRGWTSSSVATARTRCACCWRTAATKPTYPVRYAPPIARTAPGSCKPTSGASTSAAPTLKCGPARSRCCATSCCR